MSKKNPGIFVISLDFELYWGIHDACPLEKYEENLKGEYQAIPQILALFNNYKIHATWAIVGFLLYADKNSLMNNLPTILPGYKNKHLSPYIYLKESFSEAHTIYHFAPELVNLIQKTAWQEIGTHTFSHYYCLEEGQTESEFSADLAAAIQIAKHYDIEIKSIVFPRNQYNKNYLKILSEHGIIAYRGNEDNWLYSATPKKRINLLKRALRLVDSYINLSGFHCHSLNKINHRFPVNIPSSRFLRPYNPKFQLFEKLRLDRIKRSMNDAARTGKLFHLWWHPHNFGKYTKENIAFLNDILKHFLMLQKEYRMLTMNMSELARFNL